MVRPRRRRSRQAPWGVLIGAAAFVSTAPLSANLVLAAGTWTVTAAGFGVAISAVVPTGKLPTATVQPTSIRLEWAPSTYLSGREVASYVVRRQAAGSKDSVQVCTVPAPVRACEDSPPLGQPVVYTVVAAEQLWRGPASAPSSPVTLAAPAVVAAAAVPLPSPLASPSQSPDPTPLPSPIATPAPTPTPTPSPS